MTRPHVGIDTEVLRHMLRGEDALYRLRPRSVTALLSLYGELVAAGVAMMGAKADGEVSRYVAPPPDVADLISYSIAILDRQVSAAVLDGSPEVSIGFGLDPGLGVEMAHMLQAMARYYEFLAGEDPTFPAPSADALEMLADIGVELAELVGAAQAADARPATTGSTPG